MSGVFRDLYSSELEYLYGLADELGREQSRMAPVLGRGADSGVSRLMQTVAFLSAQLRQRLDDDLPDVIHPVVESLAPWLLRPLPSATIVELTPDAAMKEAQVVTAGASFTSRPIAGLPCIFRSSIDLPVRPWVLRSTEVSTDRTELRLRLSHVADGSLSAASGSLRLFFAMPIGQALELRTRVARMTSTVVARGVLGKAKTEAVLVSEAEAAVDGWSSAAIPLPAEGESALFALRAYFSWPEQFAFIEIPHLERLAALGAKVRDVSIVVHFREPLPKSLPITEGAVRLHCVPAFNIRAILTVNAPLVRRRASIAPRNAHVFSVERVTLVHDDLSTRLALPYARFFPPPVGADGRLALLYRVERVPSVTGSGLEVRLAFMTPPSEAAAFAASSVDVDLLVTDGDRAEQIGLGELSVPNPASPSLVSFRNITPVTRSAPPALEGDRLWQWVALLKTSLGQLAEPETLARALALVNVAAWARWPEAKAGVDTFEPLVSVRSSRRTRPGRDEIFPGVRVEVGLRAEGFDGLGDIDLFGQCLADLFASALRQHEWVELVLQDERDERDETAKKSLRSLFEYPARFGTRTEL